MMYPSCLSIPSIVSALIAVTFIIDNNCSINEKIVYSAISITIGAVISFLWHYYFFKSVEKRNKKNE